MVHKASDSSLLTSGGIGPATVAHTPAVLAGLMMVTGLALASKLSGLTATTMSQVPTWVLSKLQGSLKELPGEGCVND